MWKVFIAEITARAFIIADSNKRRTLSRADIAKAISKSDQFDFLIDVLPRDEPLGTAAAGGHTPGKGAVKKSGVAGDKAELVSDGDATSYISTSRLVDLSSQDDSRSVPLTLDGVDTQPGAEVTTAVLDQVSTSKLLGSG